MRAWTLLLMAVMAVTAAWAPHASGQDRIELRLTARIPPDRALLLRDIASITGERAAELGEIVVCERPDEERADSRGWFRVPLDRVRDLLELRLGDRSSAVACSGVACDVRVTRPAAAEAAAAPVATRPPAARPTAVTMAHEHTVGGAVARKLASTLGVPPSALRLGFAEGDAEFLALPTGGRVVEIAVTGSSDRMPVALTVYEGGRVLHDRSIRVEVEVLRQIAVARRVIARGQTIGSEDLSVEERWVVPSTEAIPALEAPGAVAKRRMEPGDVVERHLVTAPTVIRRGDEVEVRVVTGGFVVSRMAYALEDGVQGDRIELAAKTDRKQVLRAVVSGKGRAIIWDATAGRERGTGIAISPGGGG